MSVQRCPSCGRAWDGSSCFACGHEAGKAVAQPSGAGSARVDAPAVAAPPPPHQSLPLPSVDSPFARDVTSPQQRATPVAPAPAPATLAPPLDLRPAAPAYPPAPPPPPSPAFPHNAPHGSSAGPTFAPLPPLPPLPRSPSGAFTPGAPPSGPATLPRSPTGTFTLGAPSSSPGALPRQGTQGPAPAPVPNLGPPAFASPATTPGGPLGGSLPAAPITFPGAPTTGATRPRGGTPPAPSWPTVASPPRTSPPSSSAAAGPALDPGAEHTAEHTADVERPRGAMPEVLQRVWASPAAFAIVFALGFAVTFGPGAVWKLRSPDLQAMIESGQAHLVVATLEARERDGSIEKGDWVIYGHAIAAAYGTLRRGDMLGKYHTAVQSKRVDATALQNTIDALGDPDTQRDAVAVLKLDWPKELEPETRLQERTGDDNVLLRHAAVDALVARKAPADMVRSVRARVAVADLKTRLCPTAAEGVATLKDLVSEKAVDALRERKVADALLDLQGDADLAGLTCIDKKTMRQLHQQVAALLEGG